MAETSDPRQTRQTSSTAVREAVRSRYAAAARAVTERVVESEVGCCSSASGDCCGTSASASASAADSFITRDLYAVDEVGDLPSAAVLASLGCGNPTALAELQPGETVLDLGSGGGIDVLLSARRVGPTGFAYGLDMTDEMLDLARRNAAERAVTNVSFVKGHIEDIPLPDSSVDVVISNCVINLSADKPRVLREAFRVLRPGGRFAVSDVIVQGRLPKSVRRNMQLWAGCIAGALEDKAYTRLLRSAGFGEIGLEVTRVYDAESLCGAGRGPRQEAQTAAVKTFDAGGGRVVSAFVRGVKPR